MHVPQVEGTATFTRAGSAQDLHRVKQPGYMRFTRAVAHSKPQAAKLFAEHHIDLSITTVRYITPPTPPGPAPALVSRPELPDEPKSFVPAARTHCCQDNV